MKRMVDLSSWSRTKAKTDTRVSMRNRNQQRLWADRSLLRLTSGGCSVGCARLCLGVGTHEHIDHRRHECTRTYTPLLFGFAGHHTARRYGSGNRFMLSRRDLIGAGDAFGGAEEGKCASFISISTSPRRSDVALCTRFFFLSSVGADERDAIPF